MLEYIEAGSKCVLTHRKSTVANEKNINRNIDRNSEREREREKERKREKRKKDKPENIRAYGCV